MAVELVAHTDLPVAALGLAGRGTAGERVWREDDGALVVRYDLGPTAWAMRASAGGDRLDVLLTDDVPRGDALSVVTTVGLAAVLVQRSVSLLHASAVLLGGRAVLFVGNSGAGKSTTAAALVDRGAQLLSDDVVAVRVGPSAVSVSSGAARVRLHDDSRRLLGWSADQTQRLFESGSLGDKGFRDYGGAPGHRRGAHELATVYVLGPRAPQTAVSSRLSHGEALAALLQHTYAARLLDADGRARGWQTLVGLAARVPVHVLQAGPDMDRLHQRLRWQADSR